MARLVSVALLLLAAACDPGPTTYLGRRRPIPLSDAGDANLEAGPLEPEHEAEDHEEVEHGDAAICDAALGACLACREDNNCALGFQCSQGRCVVER